MSARITTKNTLLAAILLLCVLTSGVQCSELDDLMDKMDAKSILDNHNKKFSTSQEKNFEQPFLVFVTPWNAKGYDLAIENAKKIDYICPVWFGLKGLMHSKTSYDYFVEGRHNVNIKWIKDLKAKNPYIKIFPRVYLATDAMETFNILVTSGQVAVIAEKIFALIREYPDDFDGIMFDSPVINYPKYVSFDIIKMLEILTQLLGDKDKDLILSFMAKSADYTPQINNMEKFFAMAHKVLLMTYDYPNKGDPTYPISPYSWIKENLDFYFDEMSISAKMIQKKLMFGIPFYGYAYSFLEKKKDAVINRDYLDALEKKTNLQLNWVEKTKECTGIDQKAGYMVSFPCLKFLKTRIDLANEYELGLFVWDGGQGLDYFYELF